MHAVGPYIADFYCAAEIDGAVHGEDRQIIHDEARDAYLARLGLRVMRVPAGDVLADPDEIADGIFRVALERMAGS